MRKRKKKKYVLLQRNFYGVLHKPLRKRKKVQLLEELYGIHHYMENILTELVGLERAQQLRNTPTLDLVNGNLRLAHLFIILYRHRRNELYLELAARPTGENLRVCQE